MSNKLYSYVIPVDDGAAPNPFWGVCTLAICKPMIRRTAAIGDWVVGTGSKNATLKGGGPRDLSKCIVYAMKINDIKTLSAYSAYCKEYLQNKIPTPNSADWRHRVGDCIYDYSQEGADQPRLIEGAVHTIHDRDRDLGGKKVLLSHEYYYFGEYSVCLPESLHIIIKQNQGHRKIVCDSVVREFEEWIAKFKQNTLYGDPQRRYLIEKAKGEDLQRICACQESNKDDDEEEVSSAGSCA